MPVLRRSAGLATLVALFALATGAATASAASLSLESSSNTANQDATITASGVADQAATVYVYTIQPGQQRECSSTAAQEVQQASQTVGSADKAAGSFTAPFAYHFNSPATYKFCAYLYNQGAATSTAPLKTASLSVVVGAAPQESSARAEEIGNTSARLTADFGAAPASGHFEYGTDTSYGRQAAAAIEQSPGGSRLSAVVSDLIPGTTYHFRSVATNSYGTSYGADRTFRATNSSISLTVPPHIGYGLNHPFVISFSAFLDTQNSGAEIHTTFEPDDGGPCKAASAPKHMGQAFVQGGAPATGGIPASGAPLLGNVKLCGYLIRQQDRALAAVSAPVRFSVARSACRPIGMTVTADPEQAGDKVTIRVAIPSPGRLSAGSAEVLGGSYENRQTFAAGSHEITLKPDVERAVIPSYDHPVKLKYTVGILSVLDEKDADQDPAVAISNENPKVVDTLTCVEPDGTVVKAWYRRASADVTVTLRNHGTPPKGVAGDALGTALDPSGKKSSIKAILKAGGYVASLSLPSAGTAKVSWYYVPKGAKKAVLVASGSMAVAGKGKAKLKIKLNRKGRALLKKSKSIKLTAKGTFKPKRGALASATNVFKLKR